MQFYDWLRARIMVFNDTFNNIHTIEFCNGSNSVVLFVCHFIS